LLLIEQNSRISGLEPLNGFENSGSTSTQVKIGNLTVNIQNFFTYQKKLSDILFAIASSRLKEKTE
jgi:hypothetical protein